MKTTVIISYYKALDNLKLILKALNTQSVNSLDVIISEDDSNVDTIRFLSANKNKFKFNLLHLYQQEDLGFRKNYMLNRSILHCQTSFIIFIDGDCIPHRHFVKEYINNMENNCFFSGRSVMMGREYSKELLQSQNLKKLNFISILFSKSTFKKEAFYFPFFRLSLKSRGLVGRNWGAFKQNLLAINGFDNEYVFAGVGEDVDIEWRLLANGVERKSLKNKAIVFHLFHEKVYSEKNVKRNYDLYYKKQKLNHIKCLNGIDSVKKITNNLF